MHPKDSQNNIRICIQTDAECSEFSCFKLELPRCLKSYTKDYKDIKQTIVDENLNYRQTNQTFFETKIILIENLLVVQNFCS